MSINGFGHILKLYEDRLKEIGVPENEVSALRGRAIANCAMALPMTPLQERLRIAKEAIQLTTWRKR